MNNNCVFCDIVHNKAPANIVRRWDIALCIVPLKPVVPGHVLVLPTTHVADATMDPYVSAQTMFYASQIAKEKRQAANIITSIGRQATQTVMHLHLHVVPRTYTDRLALPWTGQK